MAKSQRAAQAICESCMENCYPAGTQVQVVAFKGRPMQIIQKCSICGEESAVVLRRLDFSQTSNPDVRGLLS